MVFVAHGQHVALVGAFLTRPVALPAAFLALPARLFLHLEGDVAPIIGVEFAVHRHGSALVTSAPHLPQRVPA